MTNPTTDVDRMLAARSPGKALPMRERLDATEAMCIAHRNLTAIGSALFRVGNAGFVTLNFTCLAHDGPRICVRPPSEAVMAAMDQRIEELITVRSGSIHTEFWFDLDGVKVSWFVRREVSL